MTMLNHRPLNEIAAEIETDWRVINNQAARHALDYMKMIGSVDAPFGASPNGYEVVGSFLAHAIGWKGDVARRVKKELREMCGHPKP
jgi:hypothetical protein